MRVNNKNWNLVPMRPSDSRLRRSDGAYVLGVCDSNAKTIYVNENLRGCILDRVILHEITHCFCFEYGLNLDMETEEMICDFMATYGREIVNIVDEIFKSVRRYA